MKPFNSAELLARVRAHDQMNQLRDLAIGEVETTVGQLRKHCRPIARSALRLGS